MHLSNGSGMLNIHVVSMNIASGVHLAQKVKARNARAFIP